MKTFIEYIKSEFNNSVKEIGLGPTLFIISYTLSVIIVGYALFSPFIFG